MGRFGWRRIRRGIGLIRLRTVVAAFGGFGGRGRVERLKKVEGLANRQTTLQLYNPTTFNLMIKPKADYILFFFGNVEKIKLQCISCVIVTSVIMNAITRTQLAELYGISTRTLSNRLKESGIELPARQLITMAKQIEIYAHLGIPGKLPENEAKKLKPKVLAYCRSNGITDIWRF